MGISHQCMRGQAPKPMNLQVNEPKRRPGQPLCHVRELSHEFARSSSGGRRHEAPHQRSVRSGSGWLLLPRVVAQPSTERQRHALVDGRCTHINIDGARTRAEELGHPCRRTRKLTLDHGHPGRRVPEVRPEMSSRIIRTVLTFGTVAGWISGVTFSGKWHGFFSVMWRDRSGAWGRPFS